MLMSLVAMSVMAPSSSSFSSDFSTSPWCSQTLRSLARERGGGEAEDGRIEMILGPMFAGKSTELMRRMRRHKLANLQCIIIKYEKDLRHGEGLDKLATHDNHRVAAVPCSRLYDLFKEASNMDVIGIDEAQFYPDLVAFCEELAEMGKIIILSALDGDFRREPFGAVTSLVPKAESIIKLTAVCKLCHREASFTRRTTADVALEAIGGEEMYMPTCRKCFRAPLPSRETGGE